MGTLLVTLLEDLLKWPLVKKTNRLEKCGVTKKMMTMKMLLLFDHSIKSHIRLLFFRFKETLLMGDMHIIVQFVTLFIQYVSEGANLFRHPLPPFTNMV